jgi:hypothetical protein
MCPCQNTRPWPAPAIDWKSRALTAEADRDRLREALERIGRRARSDGSRTFDYAIRDLGWIDDECRALTQPSDSTIE